MNHLTTARRAVAAFTGAVLALGSLGFAAAPAGAVVLPAATVSLTSTPVSPASPVNWHTSVTITATVGTVDGNQTSGDGVLFEYSKDGSTYFTISGCALKTVSSGTTNVTAVCTTTALPAGTADLRATYTGDTVVSSGLDVVAYVVNPAPSTISISSALPTSPVALGTSVTIGATLGAFETAGTVEFDYSLAATPTSWNQIAGCTAQVVVGTTTSCSTNFLPIGTGWLRAIYSGDPNRLDQTSSSFGYSVKTASTISMVAAPASPVVSPASVTLTATLGAGQSGTVAFQTSPNGTTWTTLAACSAVAISSGSAACTTVTIPPGTNFLQAIYSGDASYLSQTSAVVAYSVTGATAPTIVVTSSPVGPVQFGTSVVITATMGSSAQTGLVAFKYSTNGSTYTVLSACSAVAVSGTTATCTTTALPLGTVDLQATYSGNATYTGLTSVAYPFLVTGNAVSTVSVTAFPVSPVLAGTSVGLTATVGAGETGTVAFQYSTDGTTFTTLSACTAQTITSLSAGCVTAALPAGTVAVRAIYSGNGTFATSTSAVLPFSVTGSGASTIAIGVSPVTPGVPGTTTTITATLGVGQTGVVAFQYSSDSTNWTTISTCAAVVVAGTTAACTTNVIPVGTVALRAVYFGNATKAAATSPSYAYAVVKISGTVMLAASPGTSTVFGTLVTLTATVGLGQTGTVAFSYTVNGSAFVHIAACNSQPINNQIASCATTALPPGTKAVIAIYSGDANYTPQVSSAVSYAVKPLKASTTFSSFSGSSRALSATMKAQIRAFAALIVSNHDTKVTITAFARMSTKAASKTLSVQRANAVASYLRTILSSLHAVGVKVTAVGGGTRGRTTAQSNIVLATAQ